MPEFSAPPPESFLNLPGVPDLDLSGIIDFLTEPFDDVKAGLDGYVESAEHILEIADKVSFLFPGLKTQIHALLGFLKTVDGFLHKQP